MDSCGISDHKLIRGMIQYDCVVVRADRADIKSRTDRKKFTERITCTVTEQGQVLADTGLS